MADDLADDDPRLAEAIFRYRLIAEALEATRGARRSVLDAVAKEEHLHPDGRWIKVTRRTLERWVEKYQAQKLAGLKRRPRRDRGRARSLVPAALARAVTLRMEEPARSTRTLIDALERAGEVAKGALKRSTLDRHLDKEGASRRLLQTLGTKRHVRLAFPHPLDFVVGDFHAGPYVRTANGDIRRAELGAFIDHTSRYVPESRYFLAEDLMAVRRGLRALCLVAGPPLRVYVDGGPGYQAGRFHFGCSQLGIDVCHSRPYVSEGRGVIERFNRTVKEAFEVEVRLRKELPTLDELNALWRAWLEERYHREPHSETGEPPHERWHRLLPERPEKRVVDPVLLDEVLRLRARRKVHTKTSTVEVGGIRFVVDTALRRRRVDVLYDPHDLSSVLVFFDGRRIQRATPQVAGEPPVAPPSPATRPPPSLDYLELVRRDHERRRAAELSAIRFRAVADDDILTIGRLLERLRVVCTHELSDNERQLAAQVLDSLAPLETPIADTAFKVAVALVGHGLHASQYLEALRAHVLRARRKGLP